MFKGAKGSELGIWLAKRGEVTVQGISQDKFVREKTVMCHLAASNTPALFNGIKVGRVGRQENESKLVPDILIFLKRLRLYKPDSLLVPGSIIQNQKDSLLGWVALKEIPKGLDDGFIVKTGRLGDDQFPC